MNKNSDKKKEFTRLFLSGKYSQKELSQRVGISEQTAVRWVQDSPAMKYQRIEKQMRNELLRLTKQGYEANSDLITKLITDIERVNKLIYKPSNF
jgi:CTP-dependent riboflavin kinase